VRAAELRHRVVAVAEEDPLVELSGPLTLNRVALAAGLREVAGELVEQQAAQRAGIARVAREQRAFERLGKVRQRENRTVEVRAVRAQRGALGVGEALARVIHGRSIVAMRAVAAHDSSTAARGPRRLS